MTTYDIAISLVDQGGGGTRGTFRQILATSTPSPSITDCDYLGLVACDSKDAFNGEFRVPILPSAVTQVFEVNVFKSDDTTNSVIVTDGVNDIYTFTTKDFVVRFMVGNNTVYPVGVLPQD
jgi:hypothetical protein